MQWIETVCSKLVGWRVPYMSGLTQSASFVRGWLQIVQCGSVSGRSPASGTHGGLLQRLVR